jgi:hypothetical protein
MSMNITPHIPQVTVNSAAPATEALTRDNLVREVVPAPVATEGAVPQKSREQDSRPPNAQNPTYDTIQQEQSREAEVISEQGSEDGEQEPQQQNPEQPSQSSNDDTESKREEDNQPQSNSEDDRADEQEQKQKQQEVEAKQIRELQARDAEVRAHEQAHAAVGGSYAGAPSYEYQTGPNGKKYAVGGEVSIDVSSTPDPEQTIRKMQTVRAAALAPAEPSAQDRKVALEASQNIAEARAEMIQQVAEQNLNAGKLQSDNEEQQNVEFDGDSNKANVSEPAANFPSKMPLAGDGQVTSVNGLAAKDTNKTAHVIFNRYHQSYRPEEQGFTAVA